ncbi:hypothetical protein DSO57_1008356 [Entomophthora muscae]|uniref:Uncharacterized protein n=1 Tax=Entomophthora muscae TaxID=34485 RepID=A0ACC2S966_9FUNG|nr:hypothetical protein DSO57_1008356 [Entomophthora muscae]
MPIRSYSILLLLSTFLSPSLSHPIYEDKTYATLADLRAKTRAFLALNRASTKSNQMPSITEPRPKKVRQKSKASVDNSTPGIHFHTLDLPALSENNRESLLKLQRGRLHCNSRKAIHCNKHPPAMTHILSFIYGGDDIATESTAGTKVLPSDYETYAPLKLDMHSAGAFEKEKYPCGVKYMGELIETDQCN